MSALDGVDVDELLPGLPHALARYVHLPPSNVAWIPAVHSTAMFYAVCDVYYPSEAEMVDWVRRRAKAMGTGLYRGIMRVTGPRILLRVADKLQGLMQRGTEMKLLDSDSHQMVARLTFPPNLHTHFMLLANPPTFETLTELAGGKEPVCRLASYTETSATYELDWK